MEGGLEVRVDYISTCDLMWEMNGIIWEMNGIILKRRLLGSFHTAFLPRDIFWEKFYLPNPPVNLQSPGQDHWQRQQEETN